MAVDDRALLLLIPLCGAAFLGGAIYEYKRGYVWTGWLGREECHRKEQPGLFWMLLLVRIILGVILVIGGVGFLIRK